MEYYTGALMFGILPAVAVIVLSWMIGQIKPLRKAVMRWIEK